MLIKTDRFKKDMLIIFLSNFMFGIAMGLYKDFIPLYIKSIGGTEFSISIITALPFLFYILAIPAGILCDIIDRKILLAFGWIVVLPAPLIWYFTNSWQLFLLGQFIFSFTIIYWPAFIVYVFDYKTDANKTMAFTAVCLSGTTSSIISPISAGYLISRYGIKNMFLSAFAIYFLASLLIVQISGQKVRNSIKIREIFNCKLIKKEYNLKHLGIVLLFFNLILLSVYMIQPFLALFLENVKLLSVQSIGICFTLLYLGATFFTWINGKLSRFSKLYVIMATEIFVFCMGIALLISTNDSIFIFFAVFLIGVFISLFFLMQAEVGLFLKGNRKGLMTSFFICVSGISTSIAMLFGAFLYRISHLLVFWGAAGMSLFIIIIFLLTGLYKKIYNRKKIEEFIYKT